MRLAVYRAASRADRGEDFAREAAKSLSEADRAFAAEALKLLETQSGRRERAARRAIGPAHRAAGQPTPAKAAPIPCARPRSQPAGTVPFERPVRRPAV